MCQSARIYKLDSCSVHCSPARILANFYDDRNLAEKFQKNLVHLDKGEPITGSEIGSVRYLGLLGKDQDWFKIDTDTSDMSFKTLYLSNKNTIKDLQ